MLDQFRVDKQSLEHWLRLPDFGAGAPTESAPLKAVARLTLQPCSLNEGSEIRLHLDSPLIIRKDERVALVGPSGAGKSTLLHALAGTLHPLRQHLHLDGQTVEKLDAPCQFRRLRLSPQGDRFIPGPLPRSVLSDHEHDRAQIEHWLAQLGLGGEWYERELDGRGECVSGGEARRLSLRRLLNRPGDYNLFDEPTRGLDRKSASQTWDVLFEAFKGRGLICVTHDQEALSRFDRVIRFEDGRVQ